MFKIICYNYWNNLLHITQTQIVGRMHFIAYTSLHAPKEYFTSKINNPRFGITDEMRKVKLKRKHVTLKVWTWHQPKYIREYYFTCNVFIKLKYRTGRVATGSAWMLYTGESRWMRQSSVFSIVVCTQWSVCYNCHIMCWHAASVGVVFFYNKTSSYNTRRKERNP